MAGKTLDLTDVLSVDHLATKISDTFLKWDMLRGNKKQEWEEVRKYIFATDTTTTSNSQLPWKNKTTTPKLTQIRDNLAANYLAALFPKRKWFKWEGATKASDTAEKRRIIEAYTFYITQHPEFEKVMTQALYDWIDYGNNFVMPQWRDERSMSQTKNKGGFVGAIPMRVSPYDIVFNPIAPTFTDSPKIIKSLVTMGELKEIIEQVSAVHEDREEAEELFKYFEGIRYNVSTLPTISEKDEFFRVDGFTSFREYLGSNYVELLYFYGDIYDEKTKTLRKNRKIVVADRHKVIQDIEDPSFFGNPQIFHCGWRTRQDNLWAMGPLDNLVGLQYRIDHLENVKADVWDLIAFPVLKVKGYVEDFKWKPFERIYVGEEGDVEVLSPDAQALNADLMIQVYENKMEEMAGAPKEAMGFRTPGEKTMYEVQRLENAASRIFQSKIMMFEKQVIEPFLNAALEMAYRVGEDIVFREIDPEFGSAIWQTITADDLASAGRIRCVAARHFAEKAELVQNLNSFFQSPIGTNPAVLRHFSGIKLARMFEELLQIENYEIVSENVAISEEADAAKQSNAMKEEVFVDSQTPTGLTPDDVTPDMLSGGMPSAPAQANPASQ